MKAPDIIPHLFRTEYRKIVSVLCKHFGFDQMEIAEDIASDTFLQATQTWSYNGLPQNPVAWLYVVAKNKARNHLQRDLVFRKKVLPQMIQSTVVVEDEIDLSPQNINDSQLQMMFAISDSTVSTESQIALSLRLLCGFGIEEIATAFLTSPDAISKRLVRAKEVLRKQNIRIELPPEKEIDHRLETVLRTIYLLFSEGYYSESQDAILRTELCLEAMRLCNMLIENNSTNKPNVNALMAMMCFHASRFEARFNKNGEEVLYDEQNSDLWNAELISRGGYFMRSGTGGDHLSKYHLEAGLAYWNTQRKDSREKWEQVVDLYDRLLQIEYSPLAVLNRTYAISKLEGKRKAIREAEKLDMDNRFYYLLMGELYTEVDNKKARENLQKSLALTKSNVSKLTILSKLEKLIV